MTADRRQGNGSRPQGLGGNERRKPQMATVLIHNLQECMARGMESNNIGAAVAAARELSAMLGIGVHNRRAPHHQYRR